MEVGPFAGVDGSPEGQEWVDEGGRGVGEGLKKRLGLQETGFKQRNTTIRLQCY